MSKIERIFVASLSGLATASLLVIISASVGI